MATGLQTAGLAAMATEMATQVTHIGYMIAAGTEPVGNNYGRTVVTWNAAVAGLITNNGDLDSAVASGAWGVLTLWGGFDALAAGNEIIRGDLTNALTVNANGFVHVADTLLTIQAA